MAEKRSGGSGRPPWVVAVLVACSLAACGFTVGSAFRERLDVELWWLVPVVAALVGLIGSARPSWRSPLTRDTVTRSSVFVGLLIVLGLVVTVGLERYWTWMWVASAVSWLCLVLATVADRRPLPTS